MRLPVSTIGAELRALTGLEDAHLAEGAGADAVAAVELLERLVQGGGRILQLPVPDVEALLLELRRRVFGGVVSTSAVCPQPGCGARVDIDFQIDGYLEHHRPRTARGVSPDPEQPGWYRLEGTEVRFRLPTAGDQIEALPARDPVEFLARRTISPPDAPRALRRRVERAMARLAPSLSAEISGVCPSCSAQLKLEFDVFSFVMQELRQQAAYLFDEVHALASVYHWPEDQILAMPSTRRARYAAMVQSAARSSA